MQVQLTKSQFLETMNLPNALQKVNVATISNLDPFSEMTFTLLDLQEVLMEFKSLRRQVKNSEENFNQVLIHSGRVEM